MFGLFNKKNTIFDRRDNLIAFLVYFDRIDCLFLKNDPKNKSIVIKEAYFEPLEVDFRFSNEFLKVKFNIQKLWQYIKSKKDKKIPKNAVFFLSPSLLKTEFISDSLIRKSENKKITKDELDTLKLKIKKEAQKNGTFVNDIIYQKIFVDGYLLKDPVGLSGKEIKINCVVFKSKIDIEKKLKELSQILKLEFKGIFPLDYTLCEYTKAKASLKDAVFINVFGNSLSIFLLRDGFLDNVVNENIGWCIFIKKISDFFSVGVQEAASIKNSFMLGNLDISILDKTRKLADTSSKDVVFCAKKMIVVLDRDNILPSCVFVSFDSAPYLVLKQAFSKSSGWFSNLPFFDNIDIKFFDKFEHNFKLDETRSFRKEEDAFVYAIVYKLNNLIKKQ